MKKTKTADGIGVVMLVINAFMMIGIKSFFAPCGKKDDGSWMVCHWAGRAVIGVSLLLMILSLLFILMRDTKIKTGISIAMIPAALLNYLIPGTLISLCLKETMRCHTTMAPAVRILSAVIAVIALAEIILLTVSDRNKRKAAEPAENHNTEESTGAGTEAESKKSDVQTLKDTAEGTDSNKPNTDDGIGEDNSQ